MQARRSGSGLAQTAAALLVLVCGACAARARPAQHAEAAPRLELSAVLGCWRVSGERYEAACFQSRRGFLRAKSGAWDGFSLEWRRVSRTLFASPVPALGAELGVSSLHGHPGRELELELVSSASLLEVVGGLALTQPSASDGARWLGEVAALPDAHEVCERTRRCVAAANERLAPPSPSADMPVVVTVAVTSGDSLLQCGDARAQALEFLALRKLEIPDACR